MSKQATGPPEEIVVELGPDAVPTPPAGTELGPSAIAAMLEAMPDGLIVADHEGTILLVNAQLEELFGYTREDLLGRNVDLLLPEGLRGRHRAHRLRYRDEPEVRPMGSGRELEGLHRDGHHLAVEVSLSPLPTGTVPAVMATVRDVSSRRAAEAERRRVLAALDATKDGIALIDMETLRITHVNQGACDQLGYRRGELIGSTPAAYLPNLGPGQLRAALAPLLDGDTDLLVREVVQRHADGHDYAAEVVLQRVEGNQIVSVSRDVTDRKLHEAAQERRARFLDALASITTALLGGSWGRDAAQELARCARQLLQADNAVVAAVDDETDQAMIIGASGPVAESLFDLTVSAQHSVSANVITLRAAQRVDAAAEVARQGLDPALAEQLGQAVAVPVGLGSAQTVSLVVARPLRASPFSDEDLDLLVAFANQAEVAAELAEARLNQERFAVLEDRERIARDLHDRVIQRLFATGMRLQALAAGAGDSPVAARAEEAIDEIDASIRELRSAIFAMSASSGAGLRDQVVRLASQHSRLLGFTPTVHFEGVLDLLGPALNDHVVSALTEALSNIARHAQASEARVELRAQGDRLNLRISDNGVGFEDDQPRGNGLDNLAARAEQLGGGCTITSRPGAGTTLDWWVPTSSAATQE